MFAEFGVLNYLTYGWGYLYHHGSRPEYLFVLKTGVAHGVRKGYLAAAGVFIGDAVLMFWLLPGLRRLSRPRRYCSISFDTRGDLSAVDGR